MHGAALVALLGTLWAIYARTAGFDYVRIDDHEYVALTEPVTKGLSLEGIAWAFTTMRMSNWHPLTWISYMIDVSLFGLIPGPQHVVNVVLHGLNTALLYLLSFRILRHGMAAFVVAFLFMAHPLHVESVAWIAERKDVLSGLFWLCALWLHLRYAEAPSAGRYLLVVGAGALALMSKPMAVTLPLTLLLLDVWPLRRLDLAAPASWIRDAGCRWVLLEKLPLLAMSFGVGVLTILAQDEAIAGLVEVPLAYRAANAVIAYGTYLHQMLLPTGLAAMYRLDPIDWVGEFLPAAAVFLALCVAAYRLRVRSPWFAFGWLWFLVTLLPVIGLLQVGSQSHADRYMYVPSIGLLLALGAWLAGITPVRWRQLRLPLAAVLLFNAGMAWIQVGYWRDPYMLFSRILDVDPLAYQGHLGLAGHYLRLRRFEEAEAHGLEALRLQPGSPFVYANLGNIYLHGGEFPKSEAMFREALRLQPGYAQAMNNLGLALEAQGRLDEAKQAFLRARELDPALRGVGVNIERIGG